jgi:hypothetical protein
VLHLLAVVCPPRFVLASEIVVMIGHIVLPTEDHWVSACRSLTDRGFTTTNAATTRRTAN